MGNDDYVKKLFEANSRTDEEARDIFRAFRDGLLINTDWTQLADINISDTKRKRAQAYRQKIRDYPKAIKLDSLKRGEIIEKAIEMNNIPTP